MPAEEPDPRHSKSERAIPSRLAGGTPWTGVELLGRYRIAECVGSGGFGEVYRAEDTAQGKGGSGKTVAVKVLHSAYANSVDRLEREIAALRQLNLPGVVHFIDSGVHEETPFFVMEFIEGTPFPGEPRTPGEGGAPRSWESLEPVVIALLEALSRLHQRGYVHRDLKPQNVLVDARGVPVILDFGLAWGPELGARLTATGRFIGTPAYLAPEQHGGSVVERRADLYSLGVMMYEALSGQLPFPGLDLMEIALLKSSTTPESLHRRNAAIPLRISDLVGRLLSANPLARPEDAAEVLSIIRGERTSVTQHPWIDNSGLEERLHRGLEEQRSFDVRGAPGSGRSRALEECARLAEARGREVCHTVAADSPFASLETVLPVREAGDSATASFSFVEKLEAVKQALEAKLASGAVLLVDDLHKVDRWSAGVIDSIRASGSVVRAVLSTREGAPDVHTLVPFTRDDLRALFLGFDRVFHIPEDAAEQLVLRTDGVPDLVYEELAAWERAGAAESVDGRWRISRESIDQLSVGFETQSSLRVSRLRQRLSREEEELLAWIDLAFPHARVETLAALTDLELWRVEALLAELSEKNLVRRSSGETYGALVTGLAAQVWTRDQLRAAHRSLADQIPLGSANRLFHLIEAQSGDVALADEATREVASCGRRLFEEGRYHEAIAALSKGLKFVRSLGRTDEELEIFEVWFEAASGTMELGQFEGLRREVGTESEPKGIKLLARHIEAWISVLGDGGESVIEQLLALPTYPLEQIDKKRWTALVIASRFLSLERETEIIESLPDLVPPASRAWVDSQLPLWRGRWFYRLGKYAESAAQYEAALPAQIGNEARATSWINIAYAHYESGEFTRCRDAIGRALSMLWDGRNPPLELRCEALSRTVDYSDGKELEPDPELVDIARASRSLPILGPLLLGEAALLWRRKDLAGAARYAEEAATVWGRLQFHLPAALAGALFENCRADADPEPAEPFDAAVGAEAPGLAAQILALRARSGGEIDSGALWGYCAAFPESEWGRRREVLSIEECFRAIEGSQRKESG